MWHLFSSRERKVTLFQTSTVKNPWKRPSPRFTPMWMTATLTMPKEIWSWCILRFVAEEEDRRKSPLLVCRASNTRKPSLLNNICSLINWELQWSLITWKWDLQSYWHPFQAILSDVINRGILSGLSVRSFNCDVTRQAGCKHVHAKTAFLKKASDFISDYNNFWEIPNPRDLTWSV